MTVNLNAVSLFTGNSPPTPSAPLIEGAAAASFLTNIDGGPGFDTMTNVTGRYGCRLTFPAAISFAGSDFVSFQLRSTQYNPAGGAAVVAAGGHRVIFVDGAGNYAGYNVYGGDVPGYDASNAGLHTGFFVAYNGVPCSWYMHKDAVPDLAFGVIDWANVVAVELSSSIVAAGRKNLSILKVSRRSAPSITGTEKFKTIAGVVKIAAAAILDQILFVASNQYLQSAAGTVYTTRIGLTVGDGTTPTNLTESAFAFGIDNTYDFSPAYQCQGPFVRLGPAHVRPFKVIQSPSDVLSLTDGSFASAGWWQWELSGSGVATCTRVQYWRFDGFRAAHGHYVDCTWNDADSAVEVTAATVISGGLIRGAKATGLKVLGAAGVYSNLDLSIDSLVGAYDIELGAGGAGTYELPNITVPAGRTLRVRNNSASNAIVVVLPPGTLYSATTAGGSITVVSAGTKLTITDLPPGCDAVVLTAGTSTVLAQADELPGATFVFEYTGAPVVDIGILKPGYKPRYLRNLQLAASDSAIPVSLEIDRSYLP